MKHNIGDVVREKKINSRPMTVEREINDIIICVWFGPGLEFSNEIVLNRKEFNKNNIVNEQDYINFMRNEKLERILNDN